MDMTLPVANVSYQVPCAGLRALARAVGPRPGAGPRQTEQKSPHTTTCKEHGMDKIVVFPAPHIFTRSLSASVGTLKKSISTPDPQVTSHYSKRGIS